MAYYIRRGLVEENIETLEMIYEAVTQGRELSFSATSPEKMNSMRHHFRKILAAAKRLPTEAQGKYSTLSDSTEVSLDWRSMKLIIRPKDGVPELTPVRPGEDEALASLQSYNGTLYLLKFWPSESFSLSQFRGRVEQMGWELSTNLDTGEIVCMKQENGEHWYTAQRPVKKTESAFDILKRFSPARDES